jgi:hypothetical protein
MAVILSYLTRPAENPKSPKKAAPFLAALKY